MSWSGSVKARKFAAPGEIAALFAACRNQSADSPSGQTILRQLQESVEQALSRTPHDCDITVNTSGHIGTDGLSGSFRLEVGFGPHTFVAPAAEPEEPAVVGSIGGPAAEPEPPSTPADTESPAES